MHVTVAGSLLSRTFNNDQLSRISIGLAAFDGEVGTGHIPIDDPTAADDYKGGRQVRIDEIDTLLVDGFIGDQDRGRGPVAITNREVVYSIEDPNKLLFAKRAVRNRPVETDVARVLAFAGFDLSGVDTTWVLNTFTASMPTKRYDGEGWAELIQDVVDLTGKTLFIHDKALGGRCLHYHRLTAGHTSGLTITDAVGVANGITSFVPQTPEKKTSPADLGNNLLFVDQDGRTATYSDATSITNHDADGLAHQKIIRVEAKSQAHLDAIAASQGAETKDERFTWVCTIGPLDATALSKVRVGDLITTTSQVMGLSASAKRIAHMTQTLTKDDKGNPIPGLWDAALELGAPIRRGPGSKGKSLPKLPPGAAPAAPYDPGACAVNGMAIRAGAGNSNTGPAVDTADVLFTAGLNIIETDEHAVLMVFVADGATVDTPSGWTPHVSNPAVGGASTLYLFRRVGTGAPETVTVNWSALAAFWIESYIISGADEWDSAAGSSGTGTAINLGPIYPTPGRHYAIVGAAAVDGDTFTPVAPDGDTDHLAGGPITPGAGAVFSRTLRNWPGEYESPQYLAGTIDTADAYEGLSFAFAAGQCLVPVDGTSVLYETVGTGDGSATTFFTDFAYKPGSIRVIIDGIDVSLDIASTDPAAGSVTLDFAPSGTSGTRPAETVTADYVVAT